MAVRVRAATTLVRDRVLARRPRLRPRSRLAARLLALFAILGPGLIAANAGNDAGGIATYASVGAKYGYDLLWMMVVITVSLIVVQEMAARMGAVTGKGLSELIREQYGVRWSVFSTTSVLAANLGICISEFVGIGAALGLAHVPKYVSVPIAAAVVWLLVVRGSYKTAERVFVLMTIPFFAYPIAAILSGPTSATRLSLPTTKRTPTTCFCSSPPPARRSRPSCSSTSSRRWWSAGSGRRS
jgi:NRAMP (natural resistance-associated macrophage protein)-like metal ion transporter